MNASRADWDQRYDNKAPVETRPPSALLARYLDQLPRGRALDLACGDGRNALFLAQHGFTVDAIDFAYAGLARLIAIARRQRLAVHAVQADLDHYPLPEARYAIAVNVRYLQRSLFSRLRAAVDEGGVVVFETFLREQAQLGHPTNPAFLLERGELRQHFADFDVLLYEEGRFETETGAAYLARMLARRVARSTRD